MKRTQTFLRSDREQTAGQLPEGACHHVPEGLSGGFLPGEENEFKRGAGSQRSVNTPAQPWVRAD